MKSRIDFFLVTKTFIQKISKTEIKTSIAPDHKTVLLYLNVANNKRGPGLWKFNILLLNEESYVNLIRNSYSDIVKKYSETNDLRLKWELIKMKIRSLTMAYSKNKARKVREFEKGLEKRLQVLDEKINANMTDVNLESIVKQHEHSLEKRTSTQLRKMSGRCYLPIQSSLGRGRRETNKILSQHGEKKLQ